MQYYFYLQFQRFKRLLTEIGINPVLGMILGVVLFVGLSLLLFRQTEFAGYIYAFFGLSYVLNLGAKERTNPMQLIFTTQTFTAIRLLENTMAITPFLVFLALKNEWLILLATGLLSIVSAIFQFGKNFSFTIKTPFWNYPFEFITGFRSTVFLMIFAYIIAVKALQIGNFNLALFGLAILFLVSLSFYGKPENSYFTWIFSANSRAFLGHKIKTALICISILTLPMAAMLLICTPDKWLFVISIQAIGYILLTTMILAKYSAYPLEMNVPQALMFGMCVWFPPAILIVLPLFYTQSLKRLRSILG